MKHYKVISIIAIVLFIVGCRETTTYQEVDYTMPVLKVQPRLMYPKLAQENDYEGTSKIYLTIAEDGTVEVTRIYTRLFSRTEIESLLKECGFTIEKIYKNLKGDPLNEKSETYGVFARKNKG